MMFEHSMLRAGECAKNPQREVTGYGVHAKWSMAAPCGTSLDRLHCVSRMNDQTINLGTQEHTHTHTVLQKHLLK